MKDYKQLMEVMAMSDMNKIKGGTEQQRKIAQERQRRREEKEKKEKESSAIVKPEKKELPGQKALPPADAPGAVVKKPDVRKSQIGKWSEGIKKAPKPSGEPPIQKVKVKVDDAQAGNRPGTTRPEEPKPQKDAGEELIKNMKKKKKKNKNKEKENFRAEREARAKEKHDAWKADRAAKQKAQQDALVAKEKAKKEKEAQAAHDASQQGQDEIAKKKKEEEKKKKKAQWNNKMVGSRAASVANKGRKAVGNAARKTLNLGKRVAGKASNIARSGISATSGSVDSAGSGNLEGLSGKQSYE